MIIDAHAHISESIYGSADLYLAQLEECGIDLGVVVPGGMLDVRKMTDYITGRAKPENPEPNNHYIKESCQNHAHKLLGFICLDPHDPKALEKLEEGFRQGYRGLKISPLSHEFSFVSKSVADLASCCGDYGYPIYSHVVYNPGASTTRFIFLARQFPKTNFILGHMGFGPADQEGLEAATVLDNFYLETSTANFLHLKETVKKTGAGKIIFGSEFPLSHPAVELQKILLLKLPEKEQERILSGNIKALLRLDKGGKKRNGSRIKLKDLNRVLQHIQNAPFYHNRLPKKSLGSLREFSRIPLTTKEDLRNNSPFGLICVPKDQLYQYHESFGTTGTPVSVWLTRDDFQVNAEELMGWGVNFQPGDVVMVRFPYSISAIAHTVTTVAQLKGACVVPAGARSMVSPFPRVVTMLRKLKVTVLACLPLQALLIAETAILMGLEPQVDFPDLRAICTAGETLSPGRRKTIEDIWGAPVFDNYGMTETGAMVVDCKYKRSHPLEDYFYLEILRNDLKTPAEPGETGHLVVTTLRRQGTPLVRYLTGDKARLVPEDCPCGAKSCLEVRGRFDNIINIAGHLFDLWDIEEIVSHLPCRCFWAAGPGEDGLHLLVEEDKPGEQIPPEVLHQVENKFQIKLFITVVPKGTLYDRNELLSVGVVGKPQYIYTPQEMTEKKYLKSVRV